MEEDNYDPPLQLKQPESKRSQHEAPKPSNYKLSEKPKELMDVKKIKPYMK
jgi:hypothetical protein